MTARAPLDVDLEDKLVYGLTPMRLAYVAVALVAGFALWSSHWAPGVLRGAAAAFVIFGGAGAAWGRWRGRAADEWASDMLVFLMRNYRFEWRATRRRWNGVTEPMAADIVDRLEEHADLAA
ncbi:MAG TPA: hypothetical protein VND96_13385 [Candidatus Micrarchaeaceae archaeon]|nr:hypothetical protein [Candidatus Baltobacterales bacterium]HVC77498.1 hypothetical protein [Candidatus Micrarchaeaceae archaeon]